MENNNYFVSERGYEFDISHKILSISDFQSVLPNIKEKDIVFCKVDFLSFLAQAIPYIKPNFYLVSGRSDYTVPSCFYIPESQIYCNQILNSKNIIKWYTTNCVSHHEKFVPIPIGIDYHTMNTTDYKMFGNEQLTPSEQETILISIKNKLRPLRETTPKAVTNFHNAMDSPVLRKHYRTMAYEALKDKDCIVWLPKQERDDFWKSCDEFAFVVCPFGNGPETHRTYETLALGRIPIIQECYFNQHLFKNMPVVIVKEWNEITKEFLKEQFEKIIKNIELGVYNYERITTKFWKDLITNRE